MWSFIYEDKINDIDCDKIPFPEELAYFPIKRKHLPYDALKLFNKTTLKSLLAYSPFPNKLSFYFLQVALNRKMVNLSRDEEGICWINLRKEFIPKEITIGEDERKRGIEKAFRFYKEVCEKANEKYYQDLIEEFPESFHKMYLRRLFNPFHFPFVEGYKYLIVGDDEGKGIALKEITKGKVDIVVADIDERIVKMAKDKGLNAKRIDTRLKRNRVEEKFDVVISYSLLNSSLNSLKDFLIGATKDFGVIYISMYPALLRGLKDIFVLQKFFMEWGLWITDITPFYYRIIKIPEILYL